MTKVYELEMLPFDDKGKLAARQLPGLRVKLLEHVYPVDFGSWCYTKRKRSPVGTIPENRAIYLVDEHSLRQERICFVASYLELLYNRYQLGGSKNAIKSSVSQFRIFLTWCDSNYPDVFVSKTHAREAVDLFSHYLIQLAQQGRLSINTGASYQNVVMTTLKQVYNDKQNRMFEGIRRIRKSRVASRVIAPPTKDEAATALAVYTAIFVQLGNFVLQFKTFPSCLELPHETCWFFANYKPFVSKANRNERGSWVRGYWAYNYDEGRLSTHDEIVSHTSHWQQPPYIVASFARKILTEAERVMTEANADRVHPRRLWLCTLAQQSFVMLFSANTGMNLQQIADLKWYENGFELAKEQQGFRTVKQRAGGKETRFVITASFVKLFQTYLELRRYFLDASSDPDYSYLFFRSVGQEHRQLSLCFVTAYHKRLQRFFDVDAKVTTRQWRSNKSHWLIKYTDVATTATMLQNTPATVLKHYAGGSDSDASKELNAYFKAFKTNIVTKRKSGLSSTSVGQCSSLNSPEPLGIDPAIAPDCRTPEGCLFCRHYAVHADQADIRKLFSLQYVIRETRSLAASEAHHTQLFGEVLTRVDVVIEKLKSFDEKLEPEIEQIRRDVFENVSLTPYWGKKLQLLTDLELIV